MFPVASISTIACDVSDKVNLVLDCVKDRKHTVKTIVVIETPSDELVDRGKQAGIDILSLREMEVSKGILFTLSLLGSFSWLVFGNIIHVLLTFLSACLFNWHFMFVAYALLPTAHFCLFRRTAF